MNYELNKLIENA